MAIQLLDAAGTNKAVIDASGGIRMVPSSPHFGSNGAYRVCAYTGAMTAIAAGTATAGHIFAARWAQATKLALITNLRAKFVTVTGFTAAQEIGIDAFIARSYTASHSAQTALTLSGNAAKKRSSYSSTGFADIRISNTGPLTAGTHTLDPNPFAAGFAKEMATGAAVPTSFCELSFSLGDLAAHPIVLSENTGIVIRNVIALAAGATARFTVEMDWLEVDSY